MFCVLVVVCFDIFWIEDCAQALVPDVPWGDWQIFSPRKLFGVADGGVARCLNPKRGIGALAEIINAQHSIAALQLFRQPDAIGLQGSPHRIKPDVDCIGGQHHFGVVIGGELDVFYRCIVKQLC